MSLDFSFDGVPMLHEYDNSNHLPERISAYFKPNLLVRTDVEMGIIFLQ